MCIFEDAAWHIKCSAGLMDLAINMKAVLVASYFTALSLQVFFASLYLFCEWGKRILRAGGPWRERRELWVRGREGDWLSEERGAREGRRGQAGGRQDHQHQVHQSTFQREKKSSQEIPFRGWVEPVWHAGPDVLQWWENQKISVSLLWIFAI